VDEAVTELDLSARPHLAYDPPPLSRPAAGWALLLLYRASQALVCREIDGQAIRAVLAAPCPEAPWPSACYSADLSLRYLPELLSLARGIARDDPLVDGLLALAKAWPLSSVGVPGIEPTDASAFLSHPSLRQLYVDRIIERGDAARLADPAVREVVRQAVGGFPNLASKLQLS
jgi:MoxR-vWA-beta-propeller ternary system domain bpX4